MNKTMNNLPNDILFYVFKFFHPIEQNTLRLVCKKWKSLIPAKNFDYRITKQIKPLDVNININKNYWEIYDFLVDEDFIYLTTWCMIYKLNKFNGKKIKTKRITKIDFFINYDDKIIIITSTEIIKILDKKDLKILQENKINKNICFNKIYLHKSILYLISPMEDRIFLFDLSANLITQIKTKICHLDSGFSDNIYTVDRTQNIKIWKFNFKKRIKTIKLPYMINRFVINKINYDLCSVDNQQNIYLYDKEITLIKKCNSTINLIFSTINSYYVFKDFGDNKIVLDKLNGEEPIKIDDGKFKYMFNIDNYRYCVMSKLLQTGNDKYLELKLF